MPSATASTLLDVFGQFPGGVAGLASKLGLSEAALYKLAAGKHRRAPLRLLLRVHEAFEALPDYAYVRGRRQRLTMGLLQSLWSPRRG